MSALAKNHKQGLFDVRHLAVTLAGAILRFTDYLYQLQFHSTKLLCCAQFQTYSQEPHEAAPTRSVSPLFAPLPCPSRRMSTIGVVGPLFFAALTAVNAAAAGIPCTNAIELTNSSFQLVVSSVGNVVRVRFQDISSDLCVADGPYFYTAQRTNGPGMQTFQG